MSDGLDGRAREVLDAYKAAKRLGPTARTRVWERIEGTVAGQRATVHRLRAGSSTRRHASAATWVAALAVAAAIALLLRFVVFDQIRDEASKFDPKQQAPYAVQPEPGGERATGADPASGAAAATQRLEPSSPAVAPGSAESPLDAATATVPRPSPRSRSRSRRDAGDRRPSQAVGDGGSPGPTAGSDLAREMLLMQQARAALHREAPADALATLRIHAREFVDGQMAEDRDALRVEALCALRRVADAQTAADAFLRAHPDSPHAARVRHGCR